jgi:transposase InsO family protein
MMTFSNDGETATLFVFNQVISRLKVPREIATNHGSHFQNRMMSKLASKLGFRQDNSSPYYPQENGQVEVVKKSLKTILKRIVNTTKSNWHSMLYPVLWAY